MRPRVHFIILAVLALFAPNAYADVVWPAMYLETRLFTWWSIGLGLFVEFLFIWKVFGVEPKEAFKANLVANAVSSVLGLIFIPLGGVLWEVFPGLLFWYVLDWGTFNPLTWAATFVIACVVNALVEGYILRNAIGFNRKSLLWLLLANSISVGVAFASVFIYPVHL